MSFSVFLICKTGTPMGKINTYKIDKWYGKTENTSIFYCNLIKVESCDNSPSPTQHTSTSGSHLNFLLCQRNHSQGLASLII